MNPEETERILKIVALLQQGIVEVANFINNKHVQGTKTTQEILDHAEQSNKEAKALIDSL